MAKDEKPLVIPPPIAPAVEKTETPETVTLDGKEYTIAELSALVKGTKKSITSLLPDDTAPTGFMLLASCDLKHSQVGSTVKMRDVTPSEAMFLTATHNALAGGAPISNLQYEVETKREEVHETNGKGEKVLVGYEDVPTEKRKTVKRTPAEERLRLISKYGKARIMALFPGALPQVPNSFREAGAAGMNAEVPTVPMVEKDIAKK